MMLRRTALRQLGRANIFVFASLALLLLPPLLSDDRRRQFVDGKVRGGSLVGAIQTNAWMFAIFGGVLGSVLLWDAWRHRATDVLAGATGIRGVRALGEQTVAAWGEIDATACRSDLGPQRVHDGGEMVQRKDLLSREVDR